MKSNFSQVALFGKYQTLAPGASGASSRNALLDIAQFLHTLGCEVVIETETAGNMSITGYPLMNVAGIGRHCDLGLVVGGDGTMLGIGRQLAAYNVPLIGINQGRLGFITDIRFNSFAAALAPMLSDLTWMAALYKALVLLVIACPCALVISTPVTVVSGLSAAARRGILIKGGTYLEQVRLLKVIALDKTGTITEGKPVLVDWQVWAGADQAFVRQAAASLAARSDHPVSKAIATGLSGEVGDVQAFHALPGRGVRGMVDDRSLVLGNHRLVHDGGQCSPELEVTLARHEQLGRTVTLLADQAQVLAWFAVADTIKETSSQAIAELKSLGVQSVMLTGDNSATARTIAGQAGIDDARGDLLPQDKLDTISAMQREGGLIGMIGDGINDAPALAQADIGFAMGAAGTDTAMEAADVVIMNDNLLRVAETVRLSRRTHAVLWQNITLALGIKSVFLVMAVFGTATMWMAVFADMGASLLVIGNGLRLLRLRTRR